MTKRMRYMGRVRMRVAMIYLSVLLPWTSLYVCTIWEGLRRLRRAGRPQAPTCSSPHRWNIVRPLYGFGVGKPPCEHLPSSKTPFRVIYLACEKDTAGLQRAQAATQVLTDAGYDASWTGTAEGGLNPKATQLSQLPAPQQDDAWILCIDDDIDARTVAIDALGEALAQNSRLGAIWLPFVASGPIETRADQWAQSLFNDGPHRFPMLAALAPSNATGKVLAYRASAVHQAGGWRPHVTVFGDDIAMGQALEAQNYQVSSLPQYPAVMLRRGQSYEQVWQRQRRWARILIEQRKGLAINSVWYLGGAPLLLLGWVVANQLCFVSHVSMMIGVSVVSCARLSLVQWRTKMTSRARLTACAWALASDLLTLVAFAAALCSNRVHWAGKRAQ